MRTSRLVARTMIAASVLVFSGSVRAATFNVDTTTDDPAKTACSDDTPDDCSLHGAIVAANGLAEASTVTVPPGTYTLTEGAPCAYQAKGAGPQPGTYTSLCVSSKVTIQGAGANETIVDGNAQHSVLMVAFGAVADVRALTLTDGFGGTHGGGINNQGTLNLTDVVVSNSRPAVGTFTGAGIYNADTLTLLRTTVTNNFAPQNDSGGGIYNDGNTNAVLTLNDSIISNNTIANNGGGIMNTSGGVVTIIGSLLTGNTVSGFAGGGIYNDGTLTVSNATISGNHSGSSGAGISNSQHGSTELNNVTITANTSGTAGRGQGAGIDNALGHAFVLRNTIVAGNTDLAGTPPKPDCDARTAFASALTSQGHNLIGSTAGCDISGDATGNITGVDPKLGALADNGGFTATHGLAADSPAIDAGDPAAPGSGGTACGASDQRRLLRPIGTVCDIGAFERSSVFSLTKAQPTAGGNSGPIIVVLSGGGFGPATTVALRRAGHADIVGSPVAAESAGAALTTSFDLAGADLGAWDVVATNPGPASITLPDGFTVEAPGVQDLFAVVLARTSARPGRVARFAVLYGNRGNTDALGVPLTLGLPASFARSFSVAVDPPPAQPGQPFDDYSDVPVEATADVASEQVDIPLLIPIVPAGFTGLLTFALTPPAGSAGTEFRVEAFLGTPWFANGTLRPEVVAEAAARARQFAADRLGVTAGPELDPALIAYETAALDLAITSARGELVDSAGQIRRVFSLAYFAMDLAGYVQAQTIASAGSAPIHWYAAALVRRLATSFGLGPSAVEAQVVCPPCLCGATVPETCSCDANNCISPIDPKKPPKKKPPNGLTPAQCEELPHHVVSADGETCKPKGVKDCQAIPGTSGTSDPFCTTYPIKVSTDPNDKAGSGGSGAKRFIPSGTPLPYLIAFENLPAATAAAQTVVVTDHLDSQVLDLDSFTLGPILIANIGITPPPGLATFSGGADLRPAHDVIVRVDAALDKTTGIVTWRFTSLDPTTLETLDNPDEGFLPPNVNAPEGDGAAHFTILPKAGLASGTEIRNHASVVFDTNAPIDTPEWLNTLDANPPSSQVDGIDPLDCNATDLTIHWSGTDAVSGVGTYSLFVSTDLGPFQALLSETTDTSTTFTGETGRSYAFYTVARDGAGNLETAPAAADVVRPIGGCATNDLAVTKISAPKKVVLSAKHPTRIARVGVQVQNRSPHAETVPDVATLANLVDLGVESLAQSCPAPAVVPHVGKPQKTFPVTLKSKKTLTVLFDVTIDCANDPLKSSRKDPGHEDYSLHASVSHAALGSGDAHPVDDVCPRDVTPPGVIDPFPDGKLRDKGCGVKKGDKTFGGPVLIDVSVKP